MSFTPETLAVIVQPIGGDGIRFLSYQTDDSSVTTTAAGYFALAGRYGISLHDLIFVSPVSGGFDPYVLVAKVVDSEGNVTAVIADYEMQADVYDPQGIAADAFDRANHTGTQAISTITGLQTALDAKLVSGDIGVSVQAYDADLDTLSTNGLGTTGLALLADETAADARATIGIDALADPEVPYNQIALNGNFQHWTARPASGSIQSPGSGAGFTVGQIADGWYGGPGPSSQYTFTREVDQAEFGTYKMVLTWNASVSAGEPQHDVSGQITAGYWRFTFLELIGKFAPDYIAGKTLHFDFRGEASGNLTIVPIGWISMGIAAWAASTAYYVGDHVRNDSGNGEFGGPRVYVCTTAGTSAGSGGPTGTGSGITDGTAEWDYFGEDKGREYELYEAGANGTTMQIAWGDPHANAGCNLTTTPADFSRDIYIPELDEGTGSEYSGQANDSGSRTFARAGGGGSYFGIGYDLYGTGAQGPTIKLSRVHAYIGTRPASGRPPRLPRDLELLASNGWSQILALYGQQAATKAEQEAATASWRNVTPANQQYHPSAVKAWCVWDSTGTTVADSYNVSSVTNTGTGQETVNFTTAMASGNYGVVGGASTSNSSDATAGRHVGYATRGTTSVSLVVSDGANPEAFSDAVVSVGIFGDISA